MRLRFKAWQLVLVVTLAVWAPVVTYDWCATWDDGVFLLGNPHIRQFSWFWMLTTQWYGHWMPLTWLLSTTEWALFGSNPMPWHAVNMILHAISAVLVYFIAVRLLGGGRHTTVDQPGEHLTRAHIGAAFAALVWALHPLRMESVAWITEIKDVLMGVFFLGAAILWVQGRRGWSLAVFVAACASKSPAVILPVWLLAYEWSRGWRLRDSVRRLWPMTAVSAVVSLMAFWSLHTILVSIPWSVVGLGPRLWHVAYSTMFYAMQTVWPARLSGLIEYTWVPSWDQPQYPIAVVVVGLGVACCLLTRRRWPAITAASIAYTVAVLPQSGIFQNGAQLVGNRYSYLAVIPFALLSGAALMLASRRWPRTSCVGGLAAVVGLAVVTSLNLPMWRDGDAFWRYAAAHEPTCTQCQDMASAADIRHGDFTAALAKQQQAILVSETTMAPRWERHWNVGALLLLLHRNDEAIVSFQTYLKGGPTYRNAEENHEHMERARAALVSLGVQP